MPHTYIDANVEVLKNQPLPPSRTMKRWPFGKMEVGDAARVPDAKDWPAACKASQSVTQRKGYRFRCLWKKASMKDIEAGAAPAGFGMIYRVG